MLGSHDLPGSALVIEFSEAALAQTGTQQRAQFTSLRESGVQLCLTGVGAPGGSALTALYYPLDEYRLAPAILERPIVDPLAHDARPEERRVGQEWAETGRSRWAPGH